MKVRVEPENTTNETAGVKATLPNWRIVRRKMMDKALEGIRVIEFTHVISGPFCGMLL